MLFFDAVLETKHKITASVSTWHNSPENRRLLCVWIWIADFAALRKIFCKLHAHFWITLIGFESRKEGLFSQAEITWMLFTNWWRKDRSDQTHCGVWFLRNFQRGESKMGYNVMHHIYEGYCLPRSVNVSFLWA